MPSLFHSVTLDKDKCQGCTNCIKRCPTEAIRVRAGKAVILEEKCIDCGECIRTCPNHAKIAVADELSVLDRFEKTIALPAPSLFGQFSGSSVTVGQICQSLRLFGFDGVFPVAEAADHVSIATWMYCQEHNIRPLISAACPAIVQLIQVRFPELIPNLIKLEAPVEVAAKLAKEDACRRYNLPADRIGTVFITPCPAKVTELKVLGGTGRTYVDAIIPINVIYPYLVRNLGDAAKDSRCVHASISGFNWGRSGGEEEYMDDFTHVSVAGIHQAIDVLSEVEMGKFRDVDFLECQACPGGCVGGALTVVNPTLAKANLNGVLRRSKLAYRPEPERIHTIEKLYRQGFYHLREPVEPRPAMQLDEDLAKAVEKMRLMEKVLKSLPGLDCGSCGSPSCQALAEDIARGLATEADCVFKLREGVQVLAEELLDLAKRVPTSMTSDTEETDKNQSKSEETAGGEQASR